MTPSFRRFGIPLAIFIVGTGILGAAWWMNGAERDDLWLYIFCVWLIIYAAYEVYAGFSKRKDQ